MVVLAHKCTTSMGSTQKGQSHCSNRVPCAVGSIARSLTWHSPVAGCGLDLFERVRSIVEGLDMPQHAASKLHSILPLLMFDSRPTLTHFPHVLSSNRFMTWFATVSLEQPHHCLLILLRLLQGTFFGDQFLSCSGWVTRPASVSVTLSCWSVETRVQRATFAGSFFLSSVPRILDDSFCFLAGEASIFGHTCSSASGTISTLGMLY
jgi:hypothetical protein